MMINEKNFVENIIIDEENINIKPSNLETKELIKQEKLSFCEFGYVSVTNAKNERIIIIIGGSERKWRKSITLFNCNTQISNTTKCMFLQFL